MAYFYVRDDGTATGDLGRYATKQTGDWDATFTATTEFYTSLEAAFAATTGPADGDFLLCSSIHNKNYGVTKTITLNKFCIIMSVDDTAIDEYLAGAAEGSTGGIYDFKIRTTNAVRKLTHIGMTYSAGDDLTILNIGFSGSSTLFYNCILKCVGSAVSDTLAVSSSDGSRVELFNTDIQLADSSALTTGGIVVSKSATLIWKGGTILFNTNKPNKVFEFGGSGGGTVEVSCVDFTNVVGNITDVGGSNADDNNNLIISNCKKLSATGYNAQTIIFDNQTTIKAYSTGDGDQYYDFYYEDRYGTAAVNTSIYRDSGATYNGSNGFSLLFLPVNTVPYTQPLSVEIPGAWVGTLAASKTVTLFLVIDNVTTAATALDEHDFWVRVTRPDGTNQALGVFQESRSASAIATPAVLSTNTEAWTGVNSSNVKKYEVTVTIPALTDATNGRVLVEVCCAPTGLHADDKIYVCPDFTVA